MNTCPQCTHGYLDEVPICPRDGAVLGSPVLEGRYRLISKLGEGGMGLVYLGEHVALRKKVAVKVLRGEIAHDAQLSARFQQEAIAASQIGHEHIVSVNDFGHLGDGALFYVMEHLEGETLARALDRQRPMALTRALTLLSQIASAIGAAHERGIVHRDLKPQNVMLVLRDGVEKAKVFDFGISKVNLREAGASPITEQGALLGTAEYMAPEQAAGDSVDPRTDIYALGVMAYELVTGTLPFRGEHTIATILKQINEAPQRPTERAPWLGLPPRLDELIVRCLAKNATARPETMAEVRRELTEIGRELATGAPAASGTGVVPHDAVVAPPARSGTLAGPLSSGAVAQRPAAQSPGAPTEPGRSPTAGAPSVSGDAPPPRERFPSVGDRPGVSPALSADAPGAGLDHARPELAPTLASAGLPSARLPSESAPKQRRVLPLAVAGITTILLVALAVRMLSAGEGAPARATSDAVADAPLVSPAPSPPPAETGTRPEGSVTGVAGSESPPPATITLTSTPAGASVFRGSQRLGKTPLAIPREATAQQPLKVALRGYVTRELSALPDVRSLEVRLERLPPRTRKSRDIERVDDLKAPFP